MSKGGCHPLNYRIQSSERLGDRSLSLHLQRIQSDQGRFDFDLVHWLDSFTPWRIYFSSLTDIFCLLKLIVSHLFYQLSNLVELVNRFGLIFN